MTKRDVILRWLLSSTPFSDFQGMVELWRGSLETSIQHPLQLHLVSSLIAWKNDVLHSSSCRIVAVGFLRKHTGAAIELSSTMGKVFNKTSLALTKSRAMIDFKKISYSYIVGLGNTKTPTSCPICRQYSSHPASKNAHKVNTFSSPLPSHLPSHTTIPPP